MSSNSIKRSLENFLVESNDNELFMAISESKVSFLSLNEKKKKADIYSNTRNMLFNELDKEFKNILKNEFTVVL